MAKNITNPSWNTNSESLQQKIWYKIDEILKVVREEKTATSLALYWGVQPVVVAETSNTDELVATAAKVAEDFAGLEAGEIAVVTAGLPAGEGNTNLMKIHEVK